MKRPLASDRSFLDCVGLIDRLQWALVLAGISDFARPVEKLSLTQNFALTCTGLIWTRWCLIIKPKNYLYVPPSCNLSTLVKPPHLDYEVGRGEGRED